MKKILFLILLSTIFVFASDLNKIDQTEQVYTVQLISSLKDGGESIKLKLDSLPDDIKKEAYICPSGKYSTIRYSSSNEIENLLEKLKKVQSMGFDSAFIVKIPKQRYEKYRSTTKQTVKNNLKKEPNILTVEKTQSSKVDKNSKVETIQEINIAAITPNETKKEYLDIEPTQIKDVDKKVISLSKAKKEKKTETSQAVASTKSKKTATVKENKIDDINIFEDIVFSIDPELKGKNEKASLDKRYTLKLKNLPSSGSLDVVNMLQDSRINMALARGDILGIKNNALYGFEAFQNYGILCAPNNSLLYIVSKKKIDSIYDLRGTKISTGKISNIAQVYLKDIIENSGMAMDISFKSFDMEKSLKALKNDSIDMIFIFSSQNNIEEILNSGFKISSIPADMFRFFKKRKGLIEYNYKVDNKYISTVKAPNYLIAPLETLDDAIGKKIEAMVYKYGCYKNIQNIDPHYGKIHPGVKTAISNIRNYTNSTGLINVVFQSAKRSSDRVNYFYKIYNSSSLDMNVTFDHYETKLFDDTPIKPRHVIENFPKGIIKLKPKSDRIVTFVYKNNFTSKIKQTDVELVFKDSSNNNIRTNLRIGDE
ncbi:MAG: TAXI family TRAP transporter solute-binding subunit [Campylobacterota bacterium]|nr:TAXI family TRAP transporter solute-binding subunit [Campylobacterota bacterium]